MEVNHRDWEQRGGTIISTTASNGRIRRTFVSPSGEKFRSWKECEKYLASVNSSSDMDKTSDEFGNCKAKAKGGKKGAKNQASTGNGDGNSENENHESPANKIENGEEAEDKNGKLKYDSKVKESALKNGEEDCNGNVQKSSPKNGVKDNSAKEKSSSSDCKIISQKSDSSDFEEVASKNSNEKTKKSRTKRAKAVDSAKSSKKRNRDEKVPPKSGKKRTNEAAEIEENEKKRKMPKRAAACDDFREEKEPLRLRKADCVIESKREKIVEEEDTAVKMTFDSTDEPVIPPQRRLTDFIVHDFKGESQPIEMSDITDMFITGIILPITEDADKEKGVRCEGFGLISSWSITGYEDGVPSIWLTTSHAGYLCVKPSPQYKQFFDVLYEKTTLCVEVYRALSKPDGGDPLSGLDDMVARVVRSMNRKKSSSSRIYGREYIVTHGEFVVNQLFELDNNPSDSDQLFTGLPALVALENECRSLNRRINNNDQRNGAIRINEGGSASSAVLDAAEDMDEDEKLARLLQEQEEFKCSRQQRKSNKKKFYIKMNETEIVNDYPLPDYYKSTEDETDEYLFFDDTPMDPEDLPRRMLHEWTLYNAESRIVPLELIPMLPNMETDVDVFGSGIMTEDDGSGYCLEGDSEGRSSKLEEPQGIRIYLSAIKEWMIEFGANMLFISIRTDGAWYRLGKPSKQYSPWYQPVLKTARLAIRIITMLKEQSRASKLSFADVIRKLTEQRKNEPTYISANLVDVERYIVVHGQIILQQFAEYPDEMVRRSAFVTGLSHKMEKRQHTKLVHIENGVIIKDKNLNPRATIRPDPSRPKQMHATTTKLIYRIWKDYYSNSGTQEETETKEIVEQDEQEQSDDDDEIVIASETKSRGSSQVKTGRTKSTKIGEWVGNSNGKLSSGEALYRKALANGVVVAVGGAVSIDSYGPDDLAVILFVEYLYEKSDGTKMMHGRVLERASQTILGNAGNDLEVFLTLNCSDVSLDSVKESVSLNIQIKPWGHKYRKEGTEAQEKKQVSSGYYCKSFYVPEKGAFFTLPFDTLGLGSGKCHACIERKAEKQEFELFKSKGGFTYKGVDYCVQDFVYVDPGELSSFGDAQEVEKFKGGMNKGLRAFAICQILEVKAGSAFKSDSNSTKVSVRRFFRPEDFGPEKAYHADIKEVYYSEETCLVYVNGIRGKCEVKRQQYYAGYATCPIMDHVFWCNCIFDPSKGTVKQLPANVKFHTSKANITSKGKSPASNMNAKAKGKAVLVEATDEDKAENQDDDRLATLDIFAGCGGLSHGLKQSGACVTKWAVEYEQPAADAFKLNHPEAEVFCDNCNVILRAIMEKGGDESDCIATNEAADMAAKLSIEQKRALPVPGQVDFINGGPPCQGFSGMNRFNTSAWSKVQCEMILAFLSYADYFRPKFFLLENVRNFISFNKGQTFRLTLASLLEMGYQVRFGVLQAGNYGVSQSRKRAFIWAASPDELLPEWPEPMHVFATPQLKISLPGGKQYAAVRDASNGAPLRSITVRDTIGDLPAVGNGADKHEMKYQDDPISWFQKQIRADQSILIDHISKEMNELNLIRCQRIPKRPGADWRDLPTEKVKLSTGQMVDLIPWCLPNTAERHNQWKGLFGRLDWEGNFPTSITDPQPMGKVGMCFHPEQDRIVTVRECARSQGFPDHYKFCGTIHHRHRQIGNAVPPPLAAALGFKLKQALDTKKNNH